MKNGKKKMDIDGWLAETTFSPIKKYGRAHMCICYQVSKQDK
jgi:hypothetical protein